MTIHQFLHDLERKQILRQKDRQTLNSYMRGLDLNNRKTIIVILEFSIKREKNS